ncbi:MAG: ankyrin repeat domain-containing protein [Anaerolineae bacterium]|nr:ankyrin repeat domain-containing protein [Anaerolineae bacterium]
MNKAWQAATQQGDVEQVRYLLEAGADINARDRYGQTALMNAARTGQVELVRLLVEQGAALNTTAKYNLTALMLAIINGHIKIACILIQAGADESIRGTGAPGFYSKTALMLAEEGTT